MQDYRMNIDNVTIVRNITGSFYVYGYHTGILKAKKNILGRSMMEEWERKIASPVQGGEKTTSIERI